MKHLNILKKAPGSIHNAMKLHTPANSLIVRAFHQLTRSGCLIPEADLVSRKQTTMWNHWPKRATQWRRELTSCALIQSNNYRTGANSWSLTRSIQLSLSAHSCDSAIKNWILQHCLQQTYSTSNRSENKTQTENTVRIIGALQQLYIAQPCLQAIQSGLDLGWFSYAHLNEFFINWCVSKHLAMRWSRRDRDNHKERRVDSIHSLSLTCRLNNCELLTLLLSRRKCIEWAVCTQ